MLDLFFSFPTLLPLSTVQYFSIFPVHASLLPMHAVLNCFIRLFMFLDSALPCHSVPIATVLLFTFRIPGRTAVMAIKCQARSVEIAKLYGVLHKETGLQASEEEKCGRRCDCDWQSCASMGVRVWTTREYGAPTVLIAFPPYWRALLKPQPQLPVVVAAPAPATMAAGSCAEGKQGRTRQ
jgi:hypothetical protein